jgi:hypothetical protein
LKADTAFGQKHGAFLEANAKGDGFWLWKPYLILKTLETLEDDDILVYADAGCTFNTNGVTRLKEYFTMVQESPTGMIAFGLGYPQYQWTKEDVFQAMDVPVENRGAEQYVAGIQVIRKCSQSLQFIRDWYRFAENYNLLSDEESVQPNHPDFKATRHDQGIFSVLVNKRGLPTLSDETYFFPDWETKGKDFPIWATRKRR